MPTNRSGARRVFEVMSSRWAADILRCLAQGGKRPLELMGLIEGISQKMLTQTLRRLEESGLVARKVHAVVPPRVDYSLTPLGLTILEPMDALQRWAEKHRAELGVETARKEPPKRRSSRKRQERS